ncbi:MAG: hypothetical protein IPO58_06015 [Betaproteobacteria bacterium]|nr:hypothetical protein [Betaproteobacteria bacterium]
MTGKLDVREAAARLPDEAPLDTAEYGADLDDETEAADEEPGGQRHQREGPETRDVRRRPEVSPSSRTW